MSKPSLHELDKRLTSFEGVSTERWKETILRIKRLEGVLIGSAGTTIVLLVGILLRGA
ncbi:MAG: hypothetical protein Unbinned2026contig1000_27 [Prokaryotic dsDNA virus sp.]|nr:MAG: hypothetical protein Unbinned2026contig1000_27 [Prokaryotic dsDNA virus sp.]|tara:strand:- start:195 stop:368 length:174 start_codon:yes stop_codon:yes gene_type:complete